MGSPSLQGRLVGISIWPCGQACVDQSHVIHRKRCAHAISTQGFQGFPCAYMVAGGFCVGTLQRCC
eukprot:15481524-Alexandrium_andersonii.AAC.2